MKKKNIYRIKEIVGKTFNIIKNSDTKIWWKIIIAKYFTDKYYDRIWINLVKSWNLVKSFACYFLTDYIFLRKYREIFNFKIPKKFWVLFSHRLYSLKQNRKVSYYM